MTPIAPTRENDLDKLRPSLAPAVPTVSTEPRAMMHAGVQLLTKEATASSVEQGAALIRAAAAAGYAPACCGAAMLAAAGVGQPADWELALDHLQDGAGLGSEAAQGQLRALAGAPAVSMQNQPWRRLRESVDLQRWRDPPSKIVLSQAPRIRVVTDMAPPAVCAWLVARGRALVRRAETFDPASGEGRRDTGRTNAAAVLDFMRLDVVTVLLRNRIAQLVGTHPSALEPSQVLHYAPGERFAPHYDFLEPDAPSLQQQLSNGGQRIATVLVYLNEDYTGGETAFPRIALRHRGRAGDALMFANVDRDNAVDRLSLHAGAPPRDGEKWVFSQWIRDRARI